MQFPVCQNTTLLSIPLSTYYQFSEAAPILIRQTVAGTASAGDIMALARSGQATSWLSVAAGYAIKRIRGNRARQTDPEQGTGESEVAGSELSSTEVSGE